MSYAALQERQYIAAVNAGEAFSAMQAELVEELELSPLADALKALLVMADAALESRSETPAVKRLAERLIDACGPAEDCYVIREAAAVQS